MLWRPVVCIETYDRMFLRELLTTPNTRSSARFSLGFAVQIGFDLSDLLGFAVDRLGFAVSGISLLQRSKPVSSAVCKLTIELREGEEKNACCFPSIAMMCHQNPAHNEIQRSGEAGSPMTETVVYRPPQLWNCAP